MFKEKVVKEFVGGDHITKRNMAGITITPYKGDPGLVYAHFGNREPTTQYLRADDLRELAKLFNEIADCLDGKDD